MTLQSLPTQSWSDEDIGELVAEAYQLHYMFSSAPNHLQGSINKWQYQSDFSRVKRTPGEQRGSFGSS